MSRRDKYHAIVRQALIREGWSIIQANNTEDMIDEELVRLGIPQERIRLGLLPPDVLERFADAPSARPA